MQQPTTTTTVIVNRPGLTWNALVITATTTVELATQCLGSYEYRGLMVDGAFIALVRTAHIAANPALSDAIGAVAAELTAAAAALQPTPPYEKEIRYDPENRDFAMYLDGELMGFARTYHEAEVTLDDLVHDLQTKGAAEAPAVLDAVTDDMLFCESCGLGLAAEDGFEADGLMVCGDCYGATPERDDVALARQLVGELSEYHTMHLPCDERYDTKSQQIRSLDFDIGPAGDGTLCLYDKQTQRPLNPPAPLVDRMVAAVGCTPQQATELIAHVAAFPITPEERAILAETAPTAALPTPQRDPIGADAEALSDCLDDMITDYLARAEAADGHAEPPAFWHMRARRATKARQQVQAGAGIWWEGDQLCIESASEPGTVRRVGRTGCDCPAGQEDRWCYHRETRCAVERVEEAEAREVWAAVEARGVFGVAA